MRITKFIMDRALKCIRAVRIWVATRGSKAKILCVQSIDQCAGQLYRLLDEVYERLERESRLVGDDKITRIFRALVDDCAQAVKMARIAKQTPVNIADLKRANFDAWNDISGAQFADFSSPYAIWSGAVRHQLILRDEFIKLAAYAEEAQPKERALSHARQAMDRAAEYRILRRAAYHADRSSGPAKTFLAANRVQSVYDFNHIAAAIERWCLALLKANSSVIEGLEEAIQMTETAIAECNEGANGVPPRSQLMGAISNLGKRASTTAASPVSRRRSVVEVLGECERIFDYYDGLFEKAYDETLLQSAQFMTQVALMRLRSVRRATVTYQRDGIRVEGIVAPRPFANREN